MEICRLFSTSSRICAGGKVTCETLAGNREAAGPAPCPMAPPHPYLGEEPKAAQAADDAEDLREADATAGWLEKDGKRGLSITQPHTHPETPGISSHSLGEFQSWGSWVLLGLGESDANAINHFGVFPNPPSRHTSFGASLGLIPPPPELGTIGMRAQASFPLSNWTLLGLFTL